MSLAVIGGVLDGDARAAAGAPSAGWLGTVERDLAGREYDVTWQASPVVDDIGPSWQAPNRAQGFRTYFTADGIRVVPRTDDAPAWRWGLSLIGVGRGGATSPAVKADLQATGRRVDYRRGALGEWYENTERGLEQAFVVPAPPAKGPRSRGTLRSGLLPGRGHDVDARDLVHVDLALWGNLRPVVSADGQAIDFVTPTGAPGIRYARLEAKDARGVVLPAWMEGFAAPAEGQGGGGIRLVVDVHDAVYPLTLDPLATNFAWTAESNQANAYFGYSARTAGDVNSDGYDDVIVGAPYYDNGQTDEGRAYLFLGSASGLALVASWTAEGDQASASFGYSVGTAGDVNGDGYADVIVGAPFFDNGETDEGRAYVYLGSASGVSPTPAWTAEGNQVSAYFGNSVGTAGDVNGDGYVDVIVGAPFYDNGQIDEGRAYVYLGSASGVSPTPVWTAESNQTSAYFGDSVGTAGDMNGDGYADIIVGAPYFDAGQTDEGRVFVYLGSGAGLSTTPAWTAESDQDAALFGNSVGTAGDVNGDGYADVIVGAPFYHNGQSNEGRAFVFLGSASGVSIEAPWTAESDQVNAYFGDSVGTAGDVNGDGYADVIVGAPFYDNGEIDEGRAFVYLGSATGLPAGASWTAESNQPSAYFGWSVGTAGDVNGDGYSDLIIGAESYSGGQASEGRSYVYLGGTAGPSQNPAWTVEGTQYGGVLGWSVATAGDVNGDGYADVIVGSPFLGSDAGQAAVFLGSASGLSQTPAWTVSGQPSGGFGVSVAAAGDVNGDGYADIIVGDWFDERARVYLGSATGLSSTPSWTGVGEQPGSLFGVNVATAGDVNGDGYSDVIVGAYQFNNGQPNDGKAYLYLGSASGLSPAPAWAAVGQQLGEDFGFVGGTAGDVNGDGYDDVVVGGQLDSVYVYSGSSSGLSATPSSILHGVQPGETFGYSAGTAGDVNGDGYADIIVGAPYYAAPGYFGRAYLFLGSASGPFMDPTAAIETGGTVGTAGDVNGDGYADVFSARFLGSPVSIYLGSASGLSSSPAWSVATIQSTMHGLDEFNNWVGSAGDVNGDGYADFILGDPGFSLTVESEEGRARLFYGNGGAGLSVRPQSRRADDSVPVVADTGTHAVDSFRVAALGRSPFGRGRVKLEWEVKPLGRLFDGLGTQQSAAWTDAGTAAASLEGLVSGLDQPTYHWRARVLYNQATTPLQLHGRWFTPPWNGWNEADVTLSRFLGGAVWNDLNGDGIRAPIEPGIGGVRVVLQDGSGAELTEMMTLADGSYRFHLSGPGPFKLQFVAPLLEHWTLRDQGSDDALDSDPDPATGQTGAINAPIAMTDAVRWSAGLRPTGAVCIPPPTQPVVIDNVRTIPATSQIVLDVHDLNGPFTPVTGYNVYRSANPSVPSGPSLVAVDVIDQDAVTSGIQWIDTTGGSPPVGTAFYYQVVAYNDVCEIEGPR